MKASIPDVRAGAALVMDELALPWRHTRALMHVLVPTTVIVALLLAVLALRIEHGRTTTEIRTYEARASEAATARKQLRLELAIRGGNSWLESASRAYGLVPAAATEVVRPVEDR